MKLPGAIFLVALCLNSLRATDPAAVDYTERNPAFAPAVRVSPEKIAPLRNETLQSQRVTPPTLARKTASMNGEIAPLDVTEARDKNVVEKESRRPESRPLDVSAFSHRDSRFQPSAQLEKPPLVARYQDRLTSASATNMSRFPALDRATSAHINRFVFRKNEASGVAPATTVHAANDSAP